MKEQKLIIRVKYSLIGNTIKYAKKGYTVTEEKPTYYYCGEIGETFYKKQEGIVKTISGNCWADLVVWQSLIIHPEFCTEDNLTYNITDINNSLKNLIIKELKDRIEEIKII